MYSPTKSNEGDNSHTKNDGIIKLFGDKALRKLAVMAGQMIN